MTLRRLKVFQESTARAHAIRWSLNNKVDKLTTARYFGKITPLPDVLVTPTTYFLMGITRMFSQWVWNNRFNIKDLVNSYSLHNTNWKYSFSLYSIYKSSLNAFLAKGWLIKRQFTRICTLYNKFGKQLSSSQSC